MPQNDFLKSYFNKKTSNKSVTRRQITLRKLEKGYKNADYMLRSASHQKHY